MPHRTNLPVSSNLPPAMFGGVFDLLQAASEELIMAAVRKKKRGKKKYEGTPPKKIEKVMHERKQGTLRSGRSKKKVQKRKQALALAEARRSGANVPKRR